MKTPKKNVEKFFRLLNVYLIFLKNKYIKNKNAPKKAPLLLYKRNGKKSELIKII
jgi:hypothetical protein